MPRILVLYYSSYGHVEQMARAVAEGAASTGAEVAVKRVPELMPEEVAKAAFVKLDQEAPFADPNELGDYDAIVIGSPTRFGNMAAQMRNFLDQTGPLWGKGALVGKIGSAFTSTASQHGGQEMTLTSIHTTMLHHGMIIVGLPYTLPEVTSTASGGTPYGASHWAGAGDERPLTDDERTLCIALGKRLAETTLRLV